MEVREARRFARVEVNGWAELMAYMAYMAYARPQSGPWVPVVP